MAIPPSELCTQRYSSLASGSAIGGPSFHLDLRRSYPKFYLHPLVSVAAARSYAKAAAGACVLAFFFVCVSEITLLTLGNIDGLGWCILGDLGEFLE